MLNIPDTLLRPASWILRPLGSVPILRRAISRLIINSFASATAPRPRPFSLVADYTTWVSLTDRQFTGRHLPVASIEQLENLPSEAAVVELYRRTCEIKASDTSTMFMFFAQWFTDSFLRTDRFDYRRNTSNNEIDLCQIYGLTEEKTFLLRSMHGGQLKSQTIDGEEYPEYYFELDDSGGDLAVKAEFKNLHDEDLIVDVILALVFRSYAAAAAQARA